MEACATSNGTEIVQEPLRSGLFGPATFDVICAFQVLDHLADPVAALRICRDLLSPGGVLLLVHHDAKALSARVMGRRSPIVDVQHTFLYTKDTTRKLLEKSGFEPVHVGRAVNIASLRHLAHLAPVGRTLKNAALKMLSSLRLENVSLPLPLGNLVAIARRPVA